MWRDLPCQGNQKSNSSDSVLRGTVKTFWPTLYLMDRETKFQEEVPDPPGTCRKEGYPFSFLWLQCLLQSLSSTEWNSTSVHKGTEEGNCITRSLNDLEPNSFFFLMQRPYVQKPTVQSTLSKTKSICRYVFSHTHLKNTAKKRNNVSSAPRKKNLKLKERME